MVPIRRQFPASQFLLAWLVAILVLGAALPLPRAHADNSSIKGSDKEAGAGLYLVPYYIPPQLGDSSLIGQLAPEEDISMLLVLQLRNKERLHSFLEGLSDPKSQDYRHFLSPREFVEQFSPTLAEYSDLVDFFRHGSVRVFSHENRLVLGVSGSVHEFQEALGVRFSLHKRGDSLFYSAENPKLPSRFALVVSGIVGLDNSTSAQPSHSIIPLAANGKPPFSPQQIRSAYGVTPLLNRGIDGKGQNITIVSAYGSATLSNDLTVFANQYSVLRANGSVYYPSGQPASQNNSWAMETTLDVAWASVMAPRAVANLVVSPTSRESDLFASVNFAVSMNLGKIISLSWGSDERPQNSLFEPIFQQAVAQGIAVFAASGDCGAFAGGSPPRCDRVRRAVSYPASSQYVTAVGGTSLILDTQDRYLQETGWNGSGGGVSTVFAMPSWQKKGGVPTSTTRVLPDVAVVGDPKTGVYLTFNGKLYGFGGTSLSTPLMAGSFALANQLRGSNLGFASPLLYNHAQSPAYGTTIRDVTSGSNGFYQSTKGWDYVTGWGSPDINLLGTSFAERLRRVAVSTSIPAGVASTIVVDGEVHDVPAVLWLDGSVTHTFDANPALAASEGARYIFLGWNGLLTNTSPLVSTQITQDGSISLSYKAQYLLSVIGGSEPTNNWFDANVETRVMSSYVWNEEPSNSRIVLQSWRLGNTNPQPLARQISGIFTTPTIMMNAPYVVTFGSISQFFVEAITPLGETTGRGWYDAGSRATISLERVQLDFANRTRSLFKQWLGSAIAGLPTITITVDSSKKLTAEWKKEYLLAVKDNYGAARNDAWYEAGSKALVLVEPIIDQRNQTRRVFKGWLGDAQATTPLVEVLVDRPKALQADRTTQYFITVTSSYGTPSGGGWLDKGSQGIISVEPLFDSGNQTRRVLTGWSGTENKEPQFSLELTRPMSFEAQWKTQYLFSINSDYGQPFGGGWFDRGSSVRASVNSSLVDHGNGTRHVFAGWQDLSKENPIIFAMDSPKLIKANWRTQYFVNVTSQFGGAGGSGWYDSGSNATIKVSSSANGFLVRQVFDGWSGDLDSKEPETRILVDSPKIVTATWGTDYIQLVAVVLAVSGVALVGLLFKRRKRSENISSKSAGFGLLTGLEQIDFSED